jgi:hypothetical protein
MPCTLQTCGNAVVRLCGVQSQAPYGCVKKQ